MARNYRFIPKKITDSSLEAYVEENATNSLSDIENILGKKIIPISLEKKQIDELLNKYYQKSKNTKRIQRLVYDESFLKNLIEAAQDFNSSDIHLEPFEAKARVRIRIDGKLKEHFIIKKEDYGILVNKIKILSHLDISEKRLPQDGRMKVKNNMEEIDFRISVLPTMYGEKIVLRLLSKDNSFVNLEALGLTKQQTSTYLKNIKKPHGIILISGPTGSGKTTTLYATLKHLNQEHRNIVTIEDPIEYTIEGINQVQLRENIGLTFSNALRTFLRQDPDIIMVGEIRDSATANMAIRASLTGHLVFSTIHTNSALATISRLIDMGIPSFLLADTLTMSIAQRLVRKLCPYCKKEQSANEIPLLKELENTDSNTIYYDAVGCEACYYTGYLGRKAIYELIEIDEKIKINIRDNKIGGATKFYKANGIKTLVSQALNLYKAGETSLEEIYTLL